MKEAGRSRQRLIKITVEPAQASEREYEEAWLGALEVVWRLSRRLSDRDRTPSSGRDK